VGKPTSARIEPWSIADRADELTVRALRQRRKGELRRAAVSLRAACALDEENASRWVMLGDVLFRAGKRDEAAHALKQAVYLCEQSGHKAKANVVRRLILNLARAPE
jgi:Flp pilus assembly protein TadD